LFVTGDVQVMGIIHVCGYEEYAPDSGELLRVLPKFDVPNPTSSHVQVFW
jgi:hypothetical protein